MGHLFECRPPHRRSPEPIDRVGLPALLEGTRPGQLGPLLFRSDLESGQLLQSTGPQSEVIRAINAEDSLCLTMYLEIESCPGAQRVQANPGMRSRAQHSRTHSPSQAQPLTGPQWRSKTVKRTKALARA